mmetsp:Transcript_9397/g.25176  ORF Transcript_9397/g.25176 Transcript_9397/m.25176 type:complete len:615 (+) Transcript_9397:77-1921(+)
MTRASGRAGSALHVAGAILLSPLCAAIAPHRTLAPPANQAAARPRGDRSHGFLDTGKVQSVSLLQVASGLAYRSQGAAARSNTEATLGVRRSRDPLSADFFHPSAEAEATGDADAEIAAPGGVMDGYEVHPDDPTRVGEETHNAAFFHESLSGGPERAWQTHPAPQSGLSSGSTESGEWHMSPGGEWIQDYRAGSSLKAQTAQMSDKQAAWFEPGINQYDGFGRAKAPYPGSGKALAQGDLWSERSTNASLTCSTPGCTGSATLRVFNADTELASHCKFDFNLHPTDFDDQYSGERLTFISINGVMVNTDCFPMVSGCNATTQRPLFSCVQDLSLDHIIDRTGFLHIEAQISDVVDECPYEGNLLSAVPVVTCLVTPKPTPEPMGEPAYPPEPVMRAVPIVPPKPRPTHLYVSAPLRCPERGCTAHAEMRFNATEFRLTRCLMNVRINQTDFDGGDGTVEQIEFLKVDGATLSSNVSPGSNPCRRAWQGAPMAPSEVVHVLLSGHDVTANASTGMLSVSAKITPHVDECAQNGYLLDGFVEVNCTLGELLSTNVTVAHNATVASNGTGAAALNASTQPALSGALTAYAAPGLNATEGASVASNGGGTSNDASAQ